MFQFDAGGGGGGGRVLTFGHKRGWVVSTTFSKTLSTQVLTAKRSKLSDGRTSDLVLLSHEKVLTKAIDIGKVIDKFAEKPRRVVLK